MIAIKQQADEDRQDRSTEEPDPPLTTEDRRQE